MTWQHLILLTSNTITIDVPQNIKLQIFVNKMMEMNLPNGITFNKICLFFRFFMKARNIFSESFC